MKRTKELLKAVPVGEILPILEKLENGKIISVDRALGGGYQLFKEDPIEDLEDFWLRFEFMLDYRREYDCLPLKILHVDTNCYTQYLSFLYVRQHLHSLPEKEKINFLVYTGLFLEADAEKFAKEHLATEVEPVNPWSLDLDVPEPEVEPVEYIPVTFAERMPEDKEKCWIIGLYKGELYAESANCDAYLINAVSIRGFSVFPVCGQKGVTLNLCKITEEQKKALYDIAEACSTAYFCMIPNLEFTDSDVEDFLLCYHLTDEGYLKQMALYYEIKKIKSISTRFRKWSELC